jgi:3-hydroxyisobutyrate dehydrogenase-like beta-hydroxyacid dehydrogenase
MADVIGFVGLGRMGNPIGGRLLDAGYRLVVNDTRVDAIEALGGLGATPATSASEVASAADTVLLSLPTPDVVESVVLGESGVAQGSRVRTIVDLSTTGPRTAKRIAEKLSGTGVTWIDAPVSGGVGGAKAGTLAVMASGPREVFERLQPMLKVIGKPFFIGEEPGLAQMMKVVNNLLSGSAMAISAEAVAIGVKAGLDAATMIDVINAGSGRNSATLEKFPRSILNRRFDYGFAAGLMLKDIRLCLDEAEALGLSMPVANAVRALWQRTIETLGPESDFTRIVETVEKDAGVVVGKPS